MEKIRPSANLPTRIAKIGKALMSSISSIKLSISSWVSIQIPISLFLSVFEVVFYVSKKLSLEE